MIRVLHITNARMGSGGTETFLMNMYRNMDRDNIQFDFIVFSDEKGMHEKEIQQLGGKIYKLGRKKDGLFKNLHQIYQIVKRGKYKIVHRHCGSSIMAMDLIMSKLGGAKLLIAHAQNACVTDSKTHYLCRPILNFISNIRLACSETAGDWMYGRKKYTLMPSVIDVDKYKYDAGVRDEVRNELGLSGKFVLGNIAVFRPEKNHKFLIDVFKNVREHRDDAVLMLIGNGKLREDIEAQVKNYGLEDSVMFLGERSDIDRLYQAMDVFLLPSLFEGFPMTLIEAQTTGLPCLISDKITKEVGIVPGSVSFLSIDQTTEIWCDKLLRIQRKLSENEYVRKDCRDIIKAAGFSAYDTAKKLEMLYLKK